jgi:hypothetical protein
MSGDGPTDFFDYWDMSMSEMNRVLDRNPSIRGMVHGYLAEEKLKRTYWEPRDEVTDLRSPDDHDRNKKADWIFDYEGERIYCEVKSLQSNHIERTTTIDGDRQWTGKFQCDASDRRSVTLPDGREMETTCLVVGEFDLLAINLFEFGGEWRWAFALNEDLPRTPYSGYDPDVRQHLSKGTMDIEWPLTPESPYEAEPWGLLEREIAAR